mgnify:CR=1 FL=1|jgi:hypothetical protein
MICSKLKFLFLQNEIKKVTTRIAEYQKIYDDEEIKNLSLRQLIIIKERELNILELIFKEYTVENE